MEGIKILGTICIKAGLFKWKAKEHKMGGEMDFFEILNNTFLVVSKVVQFYRDHCYSSRYTLALKHTCHFCQGVVNKHS